MRRLALAVLLIALAGCGSIPELPESPAARARAQLAAMPYAAGNRVQLVRDGTEAFPAMFTAIIGARDHINLEYYIFQDIHLPGDARRNLFTLLAAKLRQGVAVNVIYDSYGSIDTPDSDLASLREAGARLVSFNPVNPLRLPDRTPNERDHRKIMVVDGRIGFTGGVNLDRVYENPCSSLGNEEIDNPSRACWRDTALRIEGPAVAQLQRLFLATWEQQRGPALPARNWFPSVPASGPTRLFVLGSAPRDGLPLYYRAVVDAINGARQRLWLSTGYFVPTHQERRALADAARRGVDVRLVLPRLSDFPLALSAGRASYGDLLQAGVRIFEVQGAVLHSKLVTVDGSWSAIGSSNFDHRSVALNNEVDAIIQGGEMAAEAERVLQQDMAQSREITLQAHRDRSLGERLREYYARAWIDML